MLIHSVSFIGWKSPEARAWLKAHGYKPIKRVHVVKVNGLITQRRYRIRPPEMFKRFITKKIKMNDGKEINLIFGI